MSGWSRLEAILVFELDTPSGEAANFALEVAHVQRVVELPPIFPVPLAPWAVRGIVNYDGRILTVVDPGPILHLGPQPVGSEFAVILRHGSNNVGVQVPRIRDVVARDHIGSQKKVGKDCVGWSGLAWGATVNVVDPLLFMERLQLQFGISRSAEPSEGVDNE